MWKSVVGVVGEEGYRDRGGVVERECDKSGTWLGAAELRSRPVSGSRGGAARGVVGTALLEEP